MEKVDLLQFDSPIFSKSNLPHFPRPSVSPGKNPFDDVAREAFIEGKEAFSPFKIATLNIDIGRESFPMDLNDAGRPSFGLNSLSIEFGRESLGILNLSSIRESFDLPDLNNKNEPSLMQLISPEVKLEVTSECDNNMTTRTDILNTAFLMSQSRKSSASSICKSVNFNSITSHFPSTIYCVHSASKSDSYSRHSNVMNNAVHSDSEFFNKIGDSLIFSEELNRFRKRIKSLPVTSEFLENHEKRYVFNEANQTHNSFSGVEEKEDNNFNDSVFIEANHIASRLSRGSLSEQTGIEDSDSLDSTSPPEFLEESKPEEEKLPSKSDSEKVFKTIDKLFTSIPDPRKIDLKVRTSSKTKPEKLDTTNKILKVENINTKLCEVDKNAVNEISPSIQEETLLKNLDKAADSCVLKENSGEKNSLIINDGSFAPKDNSMERLNVSRKSNSNSRSKEAREILQNLSEILNHSSKWSEGKRLINSLADIIGEGSEMVTNSLEDSGHSSIATEVDCNGPSQLLSDHENGHQMYEILDLRTSIRKESSTPPCLKLSQTKATPLSLSLKSKSDSGRPGGRLSQSLTCPRSPWVPGGLLPDKFPPTEKSRGSSISSNESHGGRSLSQNSLGKLSVKKAPEKISRGQRGPLKAIGPVGDVEGMNANNKTASLKSLTPTKSNGNSYSSFSNHKNRSPVNRPKLKPVAQSTPVSRSSKSSPLNGVRDPSYRPLSDVNKNLDAKKTQLQSVSESASDSKSKTKNDLPMFQNKIKTDSPMCLGTGRKTSVVETGSKLKGATGGIPRRRSYSLVQQSKLLTTLQKARQSILNSPFYKSDIIAKMDEGTYKADMLLKENLQSVRKNNDNVLKIKNPGKENSY